MGVYLDCRLSGVFGFVLFNTYRNVYMSVCSTPVLARGSMAAVRVAVSLELLQDMGLPRNRFWRVFWSYKYMVKAESRLTTGSSFIYLIYLPVYQAISRCIYLSIVVVRSIVRFVCLSAHRFGVNVTLCMLMSHAIVV